MKTIKSFLRTAVVSMIASVGIFGSVSVGASDHLSGLAGKIFAVKAEIIFSLDPSIPEGLVLKNCYTFHEDGTWSDPLFPDPATPVPGLWVQHTGLPSIRYTATIAGLAPGLLLIQNGTVIPGRGAGKQRLRAYSTAFVDAQIAVVKVFSRGRAVDTCPFF